MARRQKGRGGDPTPPAGRVDARFTTPGDTGTELCELLHLTDYDELDSFLMFVWDRPVSLRGAWDENGEEWIVIGHVSLDGRTAPVQLSFPLTAIDLVSQGFPTDLAEDLGPYGDRGLWDWRALQARGLETVGEYLVDKLGMTQLFNLLDRTHEDVLHED